MTPPRTLVSRADPEVDQFVRICFFDLMDLITFFCWWGYIVLYIYIYTAHTNSLPAMQGLTDWHKTGVSIELCGDLSGSMWYIPTMAFMMSKFGFEENPCSKTRKLLESVSISFGFRFQINGSHCICNCCSKQQNSTAITSPALRFWLWIDLTFLFLATGKVGKLLDAAFFGD